jgi:signal transduction histidine kinase
MRRLLDLMRRADDRVALAPGVDLAAYRFVEEALTNTLKHAGPAQARVTIRYAATDLSWRSPTTGAPPALRPTTTAMA